MSNYRRARVPGAIYFFTVALADRRSRALVEHADALRWAFVETAREHPVRVDAMVVLPDHLHAVWALPPGDADFPVRWRKLKTRFTRAVGRVGDPPTLREWPRSASKIAKGERGLWQRRYWEHMIRDSEDWRRHVEYCWINPVKHGLVALLAVAGAVGAAIATVIADALLLAIYAYVLYRSPRARKVPE